MLTIKWRPEIEVHIRAGHFNVYPKAWMNNRRIWFWQRGDDPEAKIQGAFATQREAEDVAMEWYESTQALKAAGINPSV